MHSRSFYPVHINTVRKIDWCVYCLEWMNPRVQVSGNSSSSKQPVNKSVNKSRVNLFLTRSNIKSIVSIVICQQAGKHNVNFLPRISEHFKSVSITIEYPNWLKIDSMLFTFRRNLKIQKFRYTWRISRGIFLGFFLFDPSRIKIIVT